jgi:hypothetical protein
LNASASCLLAKGRVVDLALLVARDHDQLDRAIAHLVLAGAAPHERKSALEIARVGLATHADGEATVLHDALTHVLAPQDFTGLVAHVLAAHRTQESILRRMDHHADRGDWVCCAVRLRRSLVAHAEHEQAIVMGALRRSLPPLEYQRLAGTYAAEKVRALGLLSAIEPARRPLTR